MPIILKVGAVTPVSGSSVLGTERVRRAGLPSGWPSDGIHQLTHLHKRGSCWSPAFPLGA